MRRLVTVLAVLLALALLAQPAAASLKIRLLFVDPKGSSFDYGAQVFAQEVAIRSKGQMTVEVLPGGQFHGNQLDELSILKAVLADAPEMAIVTTAPMSNFSPDLEVLDTPFLFNDYAHVDRALDGKGGEDLLAGLEQKGFHGFCFMDSGFRIFTCSRPVQGFKDFHGLRVRVMQNPVYYNFIKLEGAVPVPAPVDKIYDMASHGYIDAADRSFPTYWEFHLYDVEKYILESDHAYAAKIVLMNQSFYQKLTLAQQKVLAEAAAVARDAQRKRFRSDVEKVKARCRAMGISIFPLSPADRERMRVACQPLYDQLAHTRGHLLQELARQGSQ
ncbi:MAG: TRAP transporter substrate-binding protein [Candidatus Xenobia bacterium]